MKEMENTIRTTVVNFKCQLGEVTLPRYLFIDYSRCFCDFGGGGVRTISQLIVCEQSTVPSMMWVDVT